MAWCSTGTSVLLETHRGFTRGQSHRGKKDWKRLGGNVVLKKLWPGSTEDRSCRSPRPLRALLPTLTAAQPCLSMSLSQGFLRDAGIFITAVGSFCSLPFPVLPVVFSCFLYPFLVLAAFSFVLSLYLPAIDLNFLGIESYNIKQFQLKWISRGHQI